MVNSLVQGGAQRFTVNFAEELHDLSHDVQVLSFYPANTDFFQLNPAIPVHRFIYPFHDRGRSTPKAFRKVSRLLWRLADLKQLRHHVSSFNPDIVIAIESYVGVLIGSIVPANIPLVISERVHPAYHPLPGLLRFWQKIVYARRNSHLHAQGAEIARFLNSKYKTPVMILSNIVPSAKEQTFKNREQTVLCTARYVQQKGIDLLLEAWYLVPESSRLNWILKIYGDGDREIYIAQAKKLGIQKSVEINSAITDIEEVYSKSSIFVLASRYEGFPNSLSEAMSHGIASISTDCPSAVRDLTIDGELAKLVSIDSHALAMAIEEFILNADERESLGIRAREAAIFFEKTKVTKEWIDYFNYLIEKEYFRKNCNACDHKILNADLVEMVHTNSLELQLQQIWNIDYSFLDSVEHNIALRFECPNCKTSNFNIHSGSEDFYSSCYRSSKYSRQDNWDYQQVIRNIGGQPDLHILDVGSGYSRFLGLVDNSKSKISIVEIDETVRNDQSGEIFSSFKDIESIDGIFSVIHLSHLLEHVDNPFQYLSTLKKYLQKNGRIYVTVPNGGLTGVNKGVLDWPPHHVSRFTANGMKKLAKRCGLKITSISAKYADQDQLKQYDFMFELEVSS